MLFFVHSNKWFSCYGSIKHCTHLCFWSHCDLGGIFKPRCSYGLCAVIHHGDNLDAKTSFF